MQQGQHVAFRARIREWTEMVMGERRRTPKPVQWLSETLEVGKDIWHCDEQEALFRRAVRWWMQTYIMPMIRRAGKRPTSERF